MQIVLLTSVQYTVQFSICFLLNWHQVSLLSSIFPLIGNHKKGDKIPYIVYPEYCQFLIVTPYAQETQQILPIAFILPLQVVSALSDMPSEDSFPREREVQTIPKRKAMQLCSLCLLLMHNTSEASVCSWGRIARSLCIPVHITKETPKIRLFFF